MNFPRLSYSFIALQDLESLNRPVWRNRYSLVVLLSRELMCRQRWKFWDLCKNYVMCSLLCHATVCLSSLSFSAEAFFSRAETSRLTFTKNKETKLRKNAHNKPLAPRQLPFLRHRPSCFLASGSRYVLRTLVRTGLGTFSFSRLLLFRNFQLDASSSVPSLCTSRSY